MCSKWAGEQNTVNCQKRGGGRVTYRHKFYALSPDFRGSCPRNPRNWANLLLQRHSRFIWFGLFSGKDDIWNMLPNLAKCADAASIVEPRSREMGNFSLFEIRTARKTLILQHAVLLGLACSIAWNLNENLQSLTKTTGNSIYSRIQEFWLL